MKRTIKEKIQDILGGLFFLFVFFGVLGGLCYWVYSLWHECLQTNSWWYCAHILGK